MVDKERIDRLIVSAVSKYNSGDFDGSVRDLKAAEVMDTDNPTILYNLAVVYARQGLHNSAIGELQKILKMPSTPDIIEAKKLLSYCYVLKTLYVEAASVLKEILKISPTDVSALSMFGFCLEKIGKTDEAVKFYLKALEIKPEDKNALNSLAYIYASKGTNLNKALDLARKAQEMSPDHPAYLDTLGYVYLKMGQGAMAKKFIKKAFMLLPGSEEIREHLNELLKI